MRLFRPSQWPFHSWQWPFHALPCTANHVRYRLVALLPSAVEECIQGGSEVLTDFLLQCKNHDSWIYDENTGHHHHAYGIAAELTVDRLRRNASASSTKSKTLQRISKGMCLKNCNFLCKSPYFNQSSKITAALYATWNTVYTNELSESIFRRWYTS